MARITKNDVYRIALKNRENQFHHHDYQINMRKYELLMLGNPQTLELFVQQERENNCGHLSDDLLRNEKYLFICHAAHVTNYSIQGGFDAETAYNTSDLFIQRVDLLTSVEQVKALRYEMVEYFLKQVQAAKKEHVYSAVIVQCLDYIDRHLQETITLDALSKHVNRSRGYVSTLFKQEMRMTFTDYVRKQRINVARHMLRYTNQKYAEISNALGFSNQSYFIRVFKQEIGFTPKEYRIYFYGRGFDSDTTEAK